VFLSVDYAFNNRTEVGYIQRIAPDKAESLLKIMRMRSVKNNGIWQKTIAHTDIALQLAGAIFRSGKPKAPGIRKIEQQD
jgi:hypothetical protein